MDRNNKENGQGECCIDYCTATFTTGKGVTINSYKCNGKKLSTADVWPFKIKERKPVLKPIVFKRTIECQQTIALLLLKESS